MKKILYLAIVALILGIGILTKDFWLPPQESKMAVEEAEINQMFTLKPEISQEDDIDTIEAEFEYTDLDDFEAELDELDKLDQDINQL